MTRHARVINPNLTVFEMSCTTGAGLDAWTSWLAARAVNVHA
jgi:Ni2+-binding GTPase involved in maturation of urease and hydrogenase